MPESHPAVREEPEARAAGFACGMAHVPEVSQRFLSFWGDPGGGD